MAIQRKSAVPSSAAESAHAAPSPESSEETQASESSPVAALGAKAEAKPNEEIVALFVAYDENVTAAEQSFIELVEFIQKNQVDRNTVIASMMIARGITYETAHDKYAKMKKLLNNAEVLKGLKEGRITLKVARQLVTDKQKNPKSAKPEAKEAKFNNTLKTFVAAAKESGFTLKEIIVTVTAELKSADIK